MSPRTHLENLKGARADGIGFGVFMALHRQTDRVAFGQVRDEQGVDLLEGHDQGLIVGGGNLGDAAEILGMGVDRVFAHGPFEVPFGRLGVEGFVVMEFDPLAQVKGVGLAVRADVPVGGQAGNIFAFAVDFDQALEKVGKDNAVNGRGGVGRGVQPRWFGCLGNDQAAAFDRCFGQGRVHREGQGQRQKYQQCFFHVTSLLSWSGEIPAGMVDGCGRRSESTGTARCGLGKKSLAQVSILFHGHGLSVSEKDPGVQ